MKTLFDLQCERDAKEWTRLFHAEADAFNELIVARCNFHRETEAMGSAYSAVRMATRKLVAASARLAEHAELMRERRGRAA